MTRFNQLPLGGFSPTTISAGPSGDNHAWAPAGGALFGAGDAVRTLEYIPNYDAGDVSPGGDGNLWVPALGSYVSGVWLAKFTLLGVETDYDINNAFNPGPSYPIGPTRAPSPLIWESDNIFGISELITDPTTFYPYLIEVTPGTEAVPNAYSLRLSLGFGNFASFTAWSRLMFYDGFLWAFGIYGGGDLTTKVALAQLSMSGGGAFNGDGLESLYEYHDADWVTQGGCLGPDDNFWTTDFYDGGLWRVTPAGVATFFAVAGFTSGINYLGGSVCSDGTNLWVADPGGNVWEVTTAGVVLNQYPTLASALPDNQRLEICQTNDGCIWVSDFANKCLWSPCASGTRIIMVL